MALSIAISTKEITFATEPPDWLLTHPDAVLEIIDNQIELISLLMCKTCRVPMMFCICGSYANIEEKLVFNRGVGLDQSAIDSFEAVLDARPIISDATTELDSTLENVATALKSVAVASEPASIGDPAYLTAALDMASRGVPVFFIPAGEKGALLTKWEDKCTSDPTSILQMAKEHPDWTNYGCVGKAVEGQFFPLDLDDIQILRDWETANGQVVDFTFEVESCSGGTHLGMLHSKKSAEYFQRTGKDRIQVTGPDGHELWSMRAHDSYVLGPGSIATPSSGGPAKPYFIRCDLPFTTIPDSMFDLLVERYEAQTKIKKAAPDAAPDAAQGATINEGGRNVSLASFAGKLRSQGMKYPAIEFALLEKNRDECNPPLDDDEVKVIAASICKYDAGQVSLITFSGAPPSGTTPALKTAEPPVTTASFIPSVPEPGTTALVFSTLEDVKFAESLGFTAVLDTITAEVLRAFEFRRALMLTLSDNSRRLQHELGDGAIYFALPEDPSAIPLIYPRGGGQFGRIQPPFKSLTELQGVLSNDEISTWLNNAIGMGAVQKCRIFEGADVLKHNIILALQRANQHIEVYEPRESLRSVLEDLNRYKDDLHDASFPSPLTEASLWGPIGDFVKLSLPTTSASPEMLLYQVIPILGVMLGKKRYVSFGADKHFTSIFSLPVGGTTEGKGQARNDVLLAAETVDLAWKNTYLKTNPASGEGLVRIASGDGAVNGLTVRFALMIPEASILLNAMSRDGSNLSAMLRSAYDLDIIENERSSKSKSTRATNYISGIVGLITPMELELVMKDVDWHNGVANRFLWSIGVKSKDLLLSPKPPDLKEWAVKFKAFLDLDACLTEAQEFGFSPAGEKTWCDWASHLIEEEDTKLGLSQQRRLANAYRVANLYAQLDPRRFDGWKLALEPCHVRAGIEIVGRSRESVNWYLNRDKISHQTGAGGIRKIHAFIAAKVQSGERPEMTRLEVQKMFRDGTADQRDKLCLDAGLHLVEPLHSDGKPGVKKMVWTA